MCSIVMLAELLGFMVFAIVSLWVLSSRGWMSAGMESVGRTKGSLRSCVTYTLDM